MLKIRKMLGLYDHKKECAKWVEKNLGPEYVDEFCEKYDTLNRGGVIGDFFETAAFLHLVDKIKEEI